MNKFDEIANKVPIDKRGQIFGEIWFPTIIHFSDICDYEKLNKVWIKEILKWRTNDQMGIIRSNSRGWHSSVDMHMKKPFVNMGVEFLKIVSEIGKRLNYDSERLEPIIDNMWANVSQFGAHNRNHTHPGSLYSLVYYLQSPDDCGQIWFTDPRPQAIAVQHPMTKERRPRELLNEVYYAPVPGRVVMFPSWLTHEVEPNLSELKGNKGLRISVSANITFRFKETIKRKVFDKRKGHDSKGVLTTDGERVKNS